MDVARLESLVGVDGQCPILKLWCDQIHQCCSHGDHLPCWNLWNRFIAGAGSKVHLGEHLWTCQESQPTLLDGHHMVHYSPFLYALPGWSMSTSMLRLPTTTQLWNTSNPSFWWCASWLPLIWPWKMGQSRLATRPVQKCSWLSTSTLSTYDNTWITYTCGNRWQLGQQWLCYDKQQP